MKKLINKIYDYLCPPGNGVLTPRYIMMENKDKLHQALYKTTDDIEVLNKWKDSFKKFESNNFPYLLGITSDTGGGIQWWANWAPLFIRNQLIKGNSKFFDIGDIKVIPHLLHDKYLNEDTIQKCQEALYKKETNLPVSPLSIAEDFCIDFYKNFTDKFLFALGGDHSVSYALIKPWIQAKRKQWKKVAIIHFDAHTDIMESRFGIDICFSSWAHHILKLLGNPSLLIQFWIRNSSHSKESWENIFWVKQYWADEFLEKKPIIENTINHLKANNIDELYISFDIDVLDPKYASAIGTPEPDWLTPKNCIDIIDELSKHFKISGADLVEVAPFVRGQNFPGIKEEPERTLENACLISEKLISVLN